MDGMGIFIPENEWLEDEIPFEIPPIFRAYVGFREGQNPEKWMSIPRDLSCPSATVLGCRHREHGNSPRGLGQGEASVTSWKNTSRKPQVFFY